MKIFGYCRVSTKTQSLERQFKNIKKEFGEDVIFFSESFTGTTTERPEWKKLKSIIRKGDAIVFDSVSRMSRNSEQGTDLYFELVERGIKLIFLKEPYINSEVFNSNSSNKIKKSGEEIADEYIEATNRVFKILAKRQIKIAFEQSQKERDDIVQRIKEGQKLTKKRKGRPKTGVPAIYEKLIIEKYLMTRSYTAKEIANSYNININTFNKYVRIVREKLKQENEEKIKELGFDKKLI